MTQFINTTHTHTHTATYRDTQTNRNTPILALFLIADVFAHTQTHTNTHPGQREATNTHIDSKGVKTVVGTFS